MGLSSLQIFEDQVRTGIMEVQDQQIDLFNAKSRGAIVLHPSDYKGNYSDQSIWALVSGIVRRRNANGSGAVTKKTLSQLLSTGVKIAAGTPPIELDPGMLKWIGEDPDAAAAKMALQIAEANMADMLNTAILSAVAALGAQSAVVHDYSGTGTATLAQLSTCAGKFGDRAQDIVAWVIHSKVMFDLYGTALTGSNVLFNFGNVFLREDGFGRLFLITDAPALKNATPNPDVYHTLGLVPGAIDVGQNGDYTSVLVDAAGDENIQRTFQAEWSYNLRLKGFSWDKANGQASPSDAALGTATNWDKIATSNKDLAGVLLKSQ